MIPVNNFFLDGNEKKYLNECIDTGWISSNGSFIDSFENKFSQYIGKKYGTAVCNGSAALDIAIKALDLKKNDEIIVPSFTIISPLYSIIRNGQIPVLIDSDINTWNMDVNLIEKKITNKTKAILVVHIYGLPVDLDPIIDLCKKYNLKLIEDAAEVHGLKYKNSLCGSFSDVSTFSFYPNKHITTGEGGMVLTDDPVIKEKLDKYRNLSFEPNHQRFIHFEMGWNYRMTNLQAALGLAQLEKIDYHIKKKYEIGNYYYENLSNSSLYDLQLNKTKYSENIYWVFGLLFKGKKIKDLFVKHLDQNKIGWRPFFYGMHMQPVFKKMKIFNNNDKFPVCEKLSFNGIYIPSGLGLDKEAQDKVIEVIKSFKT